MRHHTARARSLRNVQFAEKIASWNLRKKYLEVNVVDSQTPDLHANAVGKLKTTTLDCPNIVGDISRHTDMADLSEENTSKHKTPALTEAISAILSKVKHLKEQVTTLKESVELIEVDPEVKEAQWTTKIMLTVSL